jgi:hypothetical protein
MAGKIQTVEDSPALTGDWINYHSRIIIEPPLFPAKALKACRNGSFSFWSLKVVLKRGLGLFLLILKI